MDSKTATTYAYIIFFASMTAALIVVAVRPESWPLFLMETLGLAAIYLYARITQGGK